MKRIVVVVALAVAAFVAGVWLAGRPGPQRPDIAAAPPSSAVSPPSFSPAPPRADDEGSAKPGSTLSATVQPAARTAKPADVPADPPQREATDTRRAQPVYMSLVAPPKTKVGERLAAMVNVESENDVARMQFTLRYDPARLRIVGVEAGDFMSRVGAKSQLTFGADETRGRLAIEVVEEPDGPLVAGGGTVATVRFEALKRGATELSVIDPKMSDLAREGVGSVAPPPLALQIDE